jgi:hypothetical protein
MSMISKGPPRPTLFKRHSTLVNLHDFGFCFFPGFFVLLRPFNLASGVGELKGFLVRAD